MRTTRHKITFATPEQQSVLLHAQLGIGNRELKRRTGMTDYQVNYLLHKAKVGLGREHGFRVDWRNGNHPMLDAIVKMAAGVAIKEMKRKLVPLYAHLPPDVTK